MWPFPDKLNHVKRFLYSIIFFLPAFFFFPVETKAQVAPERFKEYIQYNSLTLDGLHFTKDVQAFYTIHGYQFTWLTKQTNHLQILINYINQSQDLGLNKEDYHPDLIHSITAPGFSAADEKDSLIAEIKLTDAAIHFFHDVLMGNRPEPFSYNGLNYTPSCYNIAALISTAIEKNRFDALLDEVEPDDPAYFAVKSTLLSFQKKKAELFFKDAVITSNMVSSANRPLLTRLCQLSLLDTDTAQISTPSLKSTIKEAQSLFNLLADGILRTTIIQALNVPLEKRIAALESTLNTLRWLRCIRQNNHVNVVNIPSTTLLLFENDKTVLESRIIVGKKSTPTPTLSSKITDVILYPYWNVPYKIATKELLPSIKRNPGYLESRNFQVLNKQGKVMNPYQINWHALYPGNFPYVIRQSTGCDNSLGLIKLNFYNPFAVYLHDTPGKSMFSMNKRYFSHGCMRLEKAMEVGRYILKNNRAAIDTLTEKGCLKNQFPVTVAATEKIPVFVLYHTAWVDSASKLRFYDDVYNRFSLPKQ